MTKALAEALREIELQAVDSLKRELAGGRQSFTAFLDWLRGHCRAALSAYEEEEKNAPELAPYRSIETNLHAIQHMRSEIVRLTRERDEAGARAIEEVAQAVEAKWFAAGGITAFIRALSPARSEEEKE
jgi:hypothetical protein